jgi:PHD/YefM family antitoxin component YafN of YafNO toxin-antitoxin module
MKMAQIIPIRDLKNTAEISARCAATNEPIFVTKNGYGDMVIMSMDVYNRTMAQADLCKQLKLAEKELEEGKGIPFTEFEKTVKEKYGL